MDSQRHRIPVLGIPHRLHGSPLHSAAVKGAFAAYPHREEHPASVFHGPLDSLALLRAYIVPITGN